MNDEKDKCDQCGVYFMRGHVESKIKLGEHGFTKFVSLCSSCIRDCERKHVLYDEVGDTEYFYRGG